MTMRRISAIAEVENDNGDDLGDDTKEDKENDN
jgi:hypothetical protein